MRDDNRSRAGGAGPNEDVSADELLALLHKSVERDAKSAGGDKTIGDTKVTGKIPKKTAPLKIDDSTLDEARRELYQGGERHRRHRCRRAHTYVHEASGKKDRRS